MQPVLSNTPGYVKHLIYSVHYLQRVELIFVVFGVAFEVVDVDGREPEIERERTNQSIIR